LGSSLVLGEDPTLLGYALATTIDTGSVTSNITPYQDALGFTTTTGDVVEFTGLDSLDFAVTEPGASPVPEPSTLSLLAIGLSGLLGAALLRRRVMA
jgi:carbohydrate-binding DOMON domain-containing protein